jgi:hypothetical protein
LEAICRQLWISRSKNIGPKERPTTHFRHTHKLSLHSLSRLRKSLNQEKQRSSSSSNNNSCHSPDRYTIEKKTDPERERERERERTTFLTNNRTSNQRKKKPKPKSHSALQVLFFCGEKSGVKKRDEKKHTTITHVQSKKKNARTHARTHAHKNHNNTDDAPPVSKQTTESKPKLLNYRENKIK